MKRIIKLALLSLIFYGKGISVVYGNDCEYITNVSTQQGRFLIGSILEYMNVASKYNQFCVVWLSL